MYVTNIESRLEDATYLEIEKHGGQVAIGVVGNAQRRHALNKLYHWELSSTEKRESFLGLEACTYTFRSKTGSYLSCQFTHDLLEALADYETMGREDVVSKLEDMHTVTFIYIC